VRPATWRCTRSRSKQRRWSKGSRWRLAIRAIRKRLRSTCSCPPTPFDVRIPAELIDPDASAADPASDERRVLIIDDREDVLTGLTSVINELGYACNHALTTVVAANLLAARRYDSVLIDIQMPGKNGAELAAETRAGKGPNRETRLLGMSAAEVTARYEHGPFDACLTKPIDRNALISALRVAWPEIWPSSTV